MGIFTRFKDIVNSNINALLDKAEDPEKMLRLMIQEMEDTIIDLKSSCAKSMAEEIRLADELKAKENEAVRWAERASLALDKGKEALAREALVEKRAALEEAEKIKDSFKALNSSVDKSKAEIALLEEKLSQAKEKLKNFKDRKSNNSSRMSHFDEMEERINKMTSWREEANKEDKFKEMERDEEIEKELNRMKEERNK